MTLVTLVTLVTLETGSEQKVIGYGGNKKPTLTTKAIPPEKTDGTNSRI